MQRASSQAAFAKRRPFKACNTGSRYSVCALVVVLSLCTMFAKPVSALAAPGVEFDLARTVEYRDITPQERLTLYPMQRLIEVSLPISVRFQEVTLQDVDELDIEVNGAAAGLRVQDFAPATQLASEITHDIETTTTTKKGRSLDGTLGGALPIPGAQVVAHLTPSITAGVSGCETATEKINRLPPKHVVIVSGTYDEGRGVFYKLKRTSQTSLEGVHELAVTFVAPRTWPVAGLQVECNAIGQRKMLWVKQAATLGHAERYVQLVPAAPEPIHQVVLKPPTGKEASNEPAKNTSVGYRPAAAPARWRPQRDAAVTPVAAKVAETENSTAKQSGAVVAPSDPKEVVHDTSGDSKSH